MSRSHFILLGVEITGSRNQPGLRRYRLFESDLYDLGHELQRIAQIKNPAAQQIVDLIIACDQRIKDLRSALNHCQSNSPVHTFATRLEHYRAKALYPFKKQIIISLRDSVRSIQANLDSALQILQLCVALCRMNLRSSD